MFDTFFALNASICFVFQDRLKVHDFRLRECTIKWYGLPYPQLAYDIEFDWMMVGNRWQPVYFF